VLPSFFGIAVHDFWESYLNYPCKHAYCNAHILRELSRVEEEKHQKWAVKMRTLLGKAKKTAEIFTEKGEILPNILLKNFDERYVELIAEGLNANPPPDRIARTRGKVKKHIRETCSSDCKHISSKFYAFFMILRFLSTTISLSEILEYQNSK
jgi:transposase